MKKKLSALVLTALLCTAFTMTTFAAASESKSAGSYGTLRGTISATQIVTTVTQNPSSHTLHHNWEYQNTGGSVLGSGSYQSSGSKIVKITSSRTKPSGATRMFGTHGVKGGSSTYAVYTFTTI